MLQESGRVLGEFEGRMVTVATNRVIVTIQVQVIEQVR
jgi:hypothetical protein